VILVIDSYLAGIALLFKCVVVRDKVKLMTQKIEARQVQQVEKIDTRNLLLNLLVLLSIYVVFCSQASHADEQDPLNFIVGVSRMHDNNLFRSANNERSDNITSAYAGIRLDKQYAQQRFKFDFTLTSNKYQNFDVLDFVAKDYKAAWLWTLTPFLTGTVSLDRKQTLNSFQDRNSNATLVNIRNINVRETQHFEADYSPHNVWHILGGYTRSTQSNSNNSADYVQDGFASNSLDAGVRYQSSTGSSIAVMGHLRQGDYIDRQFSAISAFDTAYDENEVETKLDWILTQKSRITARVAYLSRDHDHLSKWDFSGLVGNVDFSWSPTAKIKLITSLYSNLTDFQSLYCTSTPLPGVSCPLADSVIDSSYMRNTTFSIKPIYAFSSKININAHVDISKRSAMGADSLSAGLNKDRVDWSKSAGVGIEWIPLRSFSVGGNIERSSRNSNIDFYDYTDTTAGVNANLFF
jgi:exopolysaccharide biosynthesis operon protein EpsL